MRRRALLSAALSTGLTGALTVAATTGTALAAVRPLPRAHAHNDYEHPRPLFDALDRGFPSVEADIYVVGDRLLVGHEPWDLRRSRTLQSLYLDPLRRNATTLPTTPLRLVVDVKTPATASWAVLGPVLDSYADLLTTWTRAGGGWQVRPGAVSVVLTGNRPLPALAALDRRRFTVEGRAGDAAGPYPAQFMSDISVEWTTTFRWRGAGPVPAADRTRLSGLVDRTHRAGRQLRFWNAPDAPGPARTAVWTELLGAGVDRINSDDLDGLAQFLRRS